MRVFVTGGAGFIGSHTTRVLCEAGRQVTVSDNLSTGRRDLVPTTAVFVRGDLKNRERLAQAIAGHEVVVHLAASIAVGVSVERPLAFVENNVLNTVRLLEAMRQTGVRRIIFS